MALTPDRSCAQWTMPLRFSLSDSIRLDEIDSATQAQLKRIDELLAGGQHDEALEIIRRIGRSQANKVVRVDNDRAMGMREYAQVLIASLPADTLAAYRKRVDPAVQAVYEQAIANRDAAALRGIVADDLCSSWGDDALLALGELALASGDVDAARAAWRRLFDLPPAVLSGDVFERVRRAVDLPGPQAALLDRFYQPRTTRIGEKTITWYIAREAAWDTLADDEAAALSRLWKERRVLSPRAAYPDTEIPKAEIRSRLVWAAILAAANARGAEREAAFADAAAQLARFRQWHPTTRGKLAGQEHVLVDKLTEWLNDAQSWPVAPTTSAWTTFAGNPSRAGVVSASPTLSERLAAPIWKLPLGPPWDADVRTDKEFITREPRIAESWNSPRSFFPVTSGETMFVATREGVFAWDLRSGQPAWKTAAGQPAGMIYRDADAARTAIAPRRRTIGVPRFTLTINGDRLAGRFGALHTSWPADDDAAPIASRIVVLDISSQGQGKLACDAIEPDGPGWWFDGSPLLDGDKLYVAMRRGDVRPQLHVACYDVRGNPPRLRWRTFIASAETPGSGRLVEYTHNLLSLGGGMLHVNTNLGAVASLSPHDGQISWVALYPRAKVGQFSALRDTPHFFRDLNPPLYHRGRLFVAPSDTPAVMALDAETGTTLWSNDAPADAVHLLGVYRDSLVASGDHLYALDGTTGKVTARWPDSVQPGPRGVGRGILAGDRLFWPAREELHVFDLPATLDAGRWTPRSKPLAFGPAGVSGGNVLFANGQLILATGNDRQAEVVGFGKMTNAK